jgi:hypothetical protein
MKQYLRAAISRLRPRAVGAKHFLAVLIVALCLLPTTARAAGLTDIITLLTTITSTIQNAIGGVLTGIQTLNSTINNFRQQVIWPVNALNQTRAFVNSTHAQYQTLMAQVHAIKNNSATLPNPTQLESLFRSAQGGSIAQLQPLYTNLYTPVPLAKDAKPIQRWPWDRSRPRCLQIKRQRAC